MGISNSLNLSDELPALTIKTLDILDPPIIESDFDIINESATTVKVYYTNNVTCDIKLNNFAYRFIILYIFAT
ncbi:hypothetical protein YK48G_09560 [Lentilactobacillus fungorum]|uniref:Uncharacterized protein n=1 Tax=Lentilactobacillus fungorum TaxID=2201250 RepID=A0ABQ3VZA6_9LACO|nr:hypothetical protein YK48G_09560 [Lentilactobacillus fungorum]